MFHDPYFIKTVEYLTGVAFLLLFIPFWRYTLTPMLAPAAAKAKAVWSGDFAEWFRMPEGLFYHPGHAWLSPDADGFVTLGVDDFAQQLVGPVSGLSLPKPGMNVDRGKKAWSLNVDGREIPMLSPVSGVIKEINDKVLTDPGIVNDDPYGLGWLMRVKPPSAKATDDLLTGEAARRWMHAVSADLVAAMNPAMGQLAQDGGMPIHGLARGLDEEHWDEVARRFLLS